MEVLADVLADDGFGVFLGDALLALFLVAALDAVTFFEGDTLAGDLLVGLIFFCTPAFDAVEAVLAFAGAARPSALRLRSVTMMRYSC